MRRLHPRPEARAIAQTTSYSHSEFLMTYSVRIVGPAISLIVAIVLASCSASKPVVPPQADKDKDPKKSIKPYTTVITKDAVSDTGLFVVHRIDEKFFFEIPNTRLGQEYLLVSRIAKTPQIGYGGEENTTQVVRWERKYDRILLRTVSYENVAPDSLPISRAVKASNNDEIIRSFPIAAYNGDTTAVVIDATDLFLSDVGILTPSRSIRKDAKLSGLDRERSYIEYIKSFPTNIEVENVVTFGAEESPQNPGARTATFTMHASMVELPANPMMPRLADPRAGFFSLYQVDYGRTEHQAVGREYLLRWRLEPKDTAAFLRGELVEPIKPITWYIDPATPEQWRPWLKKGVEDWNVAFENAGFKNAIRCIDPPTPQEDPDWSPEDARYSVIRYYPSTTENAYGPNIHDPRTGEIIESDIGWFHNILKLLESWYFTQAVSDPRTRKLPLPDSLMGELVRFVAAHEVGLTLGLAHNMRASNSYPVDSLRSPSFTAKYNTAASIMDYARFNYVAQPGDNANTMPGIGPYDKHIIRWGYRPIIGATTSDAERDTLHEWLKVTERDPMTRYGAQQWVTLDPTSQTEDLGDDAVKASTYGVANLKRIMGYLFDAVYDEGQSYNKLSDIYDDVLGQWRREMGHVAALPAGIVIDRRVYGVAGPQYTPLPKAKQREAVAFLDANVFTTPTWLLEPRVMSVLQPTGGVSRLSDIQQGMLSSLMSNGKLLRLLEVQASGVADAYSVTELYDDLEAIVFRELAQRSPVDFYRRNLQRTFVTELIDKCEQSSGGGGFIFIFGGSAAMDSDVRALSRARLVSLLAKLKAAKVADVTTKAHYDELMLQITRTLDTSR
ncbi:MAG: zinc-dependent metalloprotease [Candidatus Kapabacteria bacterium]|nr:zinc-dependent metalloprotease [Candidatus Kapabacteria bacterium]